MPKNKTQKMPINPVLEAILDELEVKSSAFKSEAETRNRRLDKMMERTKHSILVDKHKIEQDIQKGFDIIHKAAKAIVFPEDLDMIAST